MRTDWEKCQVCAQLVSLSMSRGTSYWWLEGLLHVVQEGKLRYSAWKVSAVSKIDVQFYAAACCRAAQNIIQKESGLPVKVQGRGAIDANLGFTVNDIERVEVGVRIFLCAQLEEAMQPFVIHSRQKQNSSFS